MQKCYGCGSDFVDKYRKPPFNLVLKHVDRRVIRRNEVTGQLVFSHDYSNTYYHPSCAHIRRKNPVFTGLVFISNELFAALEPGQRAVLEACDLNVVSK